MPSPRDRYIDPTLPSRGMRSSVRRSHPPGVGRVLAAMAPPPWNDERPQRFERRVGDRAIVSSFSVESRRLHPRHPDPVSDGRPALGTPTTNAPAAPNAPAVPNAPAGQVNPAPRPQRLRHREVGCTTYQSERSGPRCPTVTVRHIAENITTTTATPTPITFNTTARFPCPPSHVTESVRLRPIRLPA